jgi:hypothetical protein
MTGNIKKNLSLVSLPSKLGQILKIKMSSGINLDYATQIVSEVTPKVR